MFVRFEKIDEGDFEVRVGKIRIGRLMDFRYNLGKVEWSIDYFDTKYCGSALTIKDAKSKLKWQFFEILNAMNLTFKKDRH